MTTAGPSLREIRDECHAVHRRLGPAPRPGATYMLVTFHGDAPPDSAASRALATRRVPPCHWVGIYATLWDAYADGNMCTPPARVLPDTVEWWSGAPLDALYGPSRSERMLRVSMWIVLGWAGLLLGLLAARVAADWGWL